MMKKTLNVLHVLTFCFFSFFSKLGCTTGSGHHKDTKASYLFGEDVVCKEEHARAVGNEVGDWFHDVPGKHIPATKT